MDVNEWLFDVQEGVIRAKLQKLLEDYDDVHFERSVASEANIKLVCHFSFSHIESYIWHVV